MQPLMPPRKAHLAMLIAAGLINNQILEANGTRLLIKGTCKKGRSIDSKRKRKRE